MSYAHAMQTSLASWLALPILLTACSTPSTTTTTPAKGQLTPGDDWAARVETSAPSKELSRLTSLVGAWEVSLEDLTGDAERPRVVATGSATVRSTLGGRYLAWDVELDLEGQLVRAHGRLGYDSSHDVFQFLWLSEASPGMRIASGRGDASRGGLVLEIAERDRASGALLRAQTMLKIEDDDHVTLTQLGLDPVSSDWIPMQRTRYTRRPASAVTQEATREG